MNFDLKPSLEHMALVKIGIFLWNQNRVALISKCCYMEWEEIEERLIDKVSHLSLPQLLKEKVFGVIKPIGLQIFKWVQYHSTFDSWIESEYVLDLRYLASLPTELSWTPQGTVDKKRTAKAFVKNENLDVSTRYKLACTYCMEDDIIQLWNRLPEDVKDSDWSNSPVISFWSDNMKSGEASHISFKDVFDSSVRNSIKVAAEYFLQRLTAQEKEETLIKAAKNIDDADVLCFVLSQLNEEQQMEVFKNNPYKVLSCFLEWPWQSFFFGLANCMWDFIPEYVYRNILDVIIHKVIDGKKDWNYLKLLREFWKKSPGSLKSFITNEIDTSHLLKYLFDIKDKEIVRLILKDTTITVKEKLIYSDEMRHFCILSIRHNEWEFLEFFIGKCFPSKTAMFKFKEEFEKSMMHSYFKRDFETKKHKWDQMFRLSGDPICKYDARSLKEGESSSYN